jgi:hypothetical protein
MPPHDLERHREARALRKKAKRLRALAQDVGEKRAVKQMSRDLDAKASDLTRSNRRGDG